MKRIHLPVVLVLVLALLAACGGGGSTSTGSGSTGGSGNVDAGKALFAQQTIGANAGCISCHSLDGSKLVGPTMKGIGTRAGKEVQGESADLYIRNSILEPNAHAPSGYAVGVMPGYKGVVSDAQLNDLVAYLLSLK